VKRCPQCFHLALTPNKGAGAALRERAPHVPSGASSAPEPHNNGIPLGARVWIAPEKIQT
jgi:hypothetical protein